MIASTIASSAASPVACASPRCASRSTVNAMIDRRQRLDVAAQVGAGKGAVDPAMGHASRVTEARGQRDRRIGKVNHLGVCSHVPEQLTVVLQKRKVSSIIWIVPKPTLGEGNCLLSLAILPQLTQAKDAHDVHNPDITRWGCWSERLARAVIPCQRRIIVFEGTDVVRDIEDRCALGPMGLRLQERIVGESLCDQPSCGGGSTGVC